MRLLAAARLTKILLLGLVAGLTLLPALVRSRMRRDPALLRRAQGLALVRLCERAGPAMTKLAQLAAARADLLPAALIAPLARVQDRARPPSTRALRRALGRAYGPSEAWPFAIDNWTPVAAGSVAAVLAARLPGGEAIALKVVRPGVGARIRADLVWLGWLLGLAARLQAFRAIPLRHAFAQLAPLIARQADMFEEALSGTRLGMAAGPGVILPAIVPDLTRASVLAMRFERAAHRLTDPAVPQPVYEQGCRLLLAALYRMIFVTGFVHCDLHPGNVGCDDQGRVILYDYGLVAEVTEADRAILVGLFTAITTRDPVRAAREILASAATIPPDLDRNSVIADADLLLERWAGKNAGEFLVAALVRDLFALQHRHGIVAMPSFAAAIWSLATFEGLVRHRYPQLDFQEQAKPFLISHLLISSRW